jgi:hypothetical protein
MKFKIDFRPILKDPLHGFRIVFYVIAAAVILVPLQRALLHGAGWGEPIGQVFSLLPPAQPPILAGGIEVQEGLLGFNGQSARGIWTGQVTTVLAAVIVSYLICPTLLVWGIRARTRYRNKMPVRGGATSVVLALTFGGFSLLTILPAPVNAILSGRTYAMMNRDCRSSEILDAVSVDLYMMARRAQVNFFLSGHDREKKLSWLTPGTSAKSAIDISSLLPPGKASTSPDSLYVSGDGSRFTLRVERADSLTIHVIRDTEGSGLEGDAPEGAATRLQMCAGVTPEHVNMVLVN